MQLHLYAFTSSRSLTRSLVIQSFRFSYYSHNCISDVPPVAFENIIIIDFLFFSNPEVKCCGMQYRENAHSFFSRCNLNGAPFAQPSRKYANNSLIFRCCCCWIFVTSFNEMDSCHFKKHAFPTAHFRFNFLECHTNIVTYDGSNELIIWILTSLHNLHTSKKTLDFFLLSISRSSFSFYIRMLVYLCSSWGGFCKLLVYVKPFVSKSRCNFKWIEIEWETERAWKKKTYLIAAKCLIFVHKLQLGNGTKKHVQ